MAYFSSLLRAVLNYASDKYISIKQELDFLEHYIALEKMRHKDAFEVDFNIEGDISLTRTMIPPMLLQPIIENAIKHGELSKLKNGLISCDFYINNKYLYCSITDNGIGRKASASKQNKVHQSKAIGIIQERLSLLSEEPEIGIEIFDLPQGTKVVLKLPVL